MLLNVTPAVFSALRRDFTRNLGFAIEVDPINQKSQNQAKNILMGLPSTPIKLEANRSMGSRAMIGRRLQLYTYIKRQRYYW